MRSCPPFPPPPWTFVLAVLVVLALPLGGSAPRAEDGVTLRGYLLEDRWRWASARNGRVELQHRETYEVPAGRVLVLDEISVTFTVHRLGFYRWSLEVQLPGRPEPISLHHTIALQAGNAEPAFRSTVSRVSFSPGLPLPPGTRLQVPCLLPTRSRLLGFTLLGRMSEPSGADPPRGPSDLESGLGERPPTAPSSSCRGLRPLARRKEGT